MLKDFLYLKEKNLKDIIELLLKAYSSSFSDSEQTLKRNHLGKAHHRLIILLDNNPGIKVTEILNHLKVTKQSLNRVIQDLLKNFLIYFHFIYFFNLLRISFKVLSVEL